MKLCLIGKGSGESLSTTRTDSNLDPDRDTVSAPVSKKNEIRNLEASVSALRRLQAGVTLKKSAPGQAVLDSILTRRLSDRRDQLERSRRSRSVIVQRTSTPNVSSNGEDYLRIAFGVEDTIPPPPPPPLHLAPFPIFQDPPNPPVHLQAIRPSLRIPVLPTPSPVLTGAEGDQENLPVFDYPAAAMAGDTQLSEEQKKKAKEADQRITKLIQKLSTLMEMYPVDFYDGRVLAANKEKWLGKI